MTPSEDKNSETLLDAAGHPATTVAPKVLDHELIRRIGQGSYGEVWLARNAVGTLRAVKVVLRSRFKDDRPYEREFSGIQKYEPISRSNEGLVDVLQIGRNDAEGYFYYVMELADDATNGTRSEGVHEKRSDGAVPEILAAGWPASVLNQHAYVPKTLASELRARGRLSVEECVTLGLNLNLALGHLHRHGLIHRDVKPSNIILVSGVPKLADIGLVVELAEAQSFVGTEGFIPPEGPNSPQADLYALGKVLYEASMGKDRHEFPEPYSGVGTDPDAKALMELNAVLLKACAPAARDRYRSAEEMNADLALLHSGQSVQQKHVLQRQVKVLTRVGVGLAGVLVLAAVPYYWAIKEARAAKLAAKQEFQQRQRSEQVAQFLEDMLNGVDPSVAKGSDTTLLRSIVDRTAQRVSRDLANQPEVQIALNRTLANVYHRLALFPQMEQLARENLRLHRGMAGDNRKKIGDDLSGVALALMEQGRLTEAEATAREALTLLKEAGGQRRVELAETLNILASVLGMRGRLAEAESIGREATAAYKEVYGAEHARVAACLMNVGNTLRREAKLHEAEEAIREALRIQQRVLGPEHAEVAMSLENLAAALSDQGKHESAEGVIRQALAVERKLMGNESFPVGRTLTSLGQTLADQEKWGEAEILLREALQIKRKALPNGHPSVAFTLNSLADVLRAQDKLVEAEQVTIEALQIRTKALGPDHELIADLLNLRAQIKQSQGALAEAEVFAKDALAMRRKVLPPDHPAVAAGLRGLGDILQSEKKLQEASDAYLEGLSIIRKNPENPGVQLLLASAEQLVEKLQREPSSIDAEPLARACVEIREELLLED